MRHDAIWIVVPAYNEAVALGAVLKGLLNHFPHVVVVDDASTDDTANTAKIFPVHLLRHPINLGQGAALKTGITYSLTQGARIVVTFDADGQMEPGDIAQLCEPLVRGDADIVLGTRFRGPSEVPYLRALFLRLGAYATSLASGVRLSDVHNGLRALNRHAAEKIDISHNRMAHASQIIHQAADLRLRIQEIPVRIRYSPYSLKKGQTLFEMINIFWDLLLH